MNTVVLYRGPFQGRRIRFLLDVSARVFGSVDFVWLNPSFDPNGDRSWATEMPEERPFLGAVEELPGDWRKAPRTLAALRRRWNRPPAIVAVGFTALPYARALRPRRLVWTVNGIPEERLLHRSGRLARLSVRLAWASVRFGRRPDAVVVVSEPMGRLVERRVPGVRWTHAPTSVDLECFVPSVTPERRSYLTYVGSGAPWQGVDALARIWTAVHAADPSARFRIVSKDSRAHEIARALPDDSVEIVSAVFPSDVARLLWEADLGFLVRMPDVVNETSFPTKFGEYLAAGVPVVTTDIGWEVGDVIKRHDCGLLVDPGADPTAIARSVLDFRARVASDPDMRHRCERAARDLSREVWLDRLSRSLEELV